MTSPEAIDAALSHIVRAEEWLAGSLPTERATQRATAHASIALALASIAPQLPGGPLYRGDL